MTQNATVQIETYPIAGGFRISREIKPDAIVVVVRLERNGVSGMGECLPLKRYGDTAASVKTEIEEWLAAGHEWNRQTLIKTMRAGPGRFALDTAMWLLEANELKIPLWQHVGFKQAPGALPTVYTLDGADPETMAERAAHHQEYKWLKVKLMGDGHDHARLTLIHLAAPHQPLIVDANEALDEESLAELIPLFIANDVCLIEQPLPEGKDSILKIMQLPIPLAADESCHSMDDLDHLQGKYQVANIKLDKCGGLTHGLEMVKRAKALGLDVMVGCMVSTSLGILPAFFLAQQASFIDLDGFILLEKDREPPLLAYSNGMISLLG